MGHLGRWSLVVGLLLAGGRLRAQAWNAPAARALAARAAARRESTAADSALSAWRARAHGLVFFLAQVGDGLAGAPRLVRADELDVEVYWRSPGLSKQIIRGWRSRSWLPADVTYHRDHLGIVTNGFGDFIRIGEGDEVRDVPHPLSLAGLDRYAFALTDSIRITSGATTIVLDVLDVRPRDLSLPGVIGTLYLDRATAELVRFRFGFTPSAYLDRELEDITVLLENARIDGRAWLPFRQEIELRRRTSWFDFPARGIIRGRWTVGDYDLAFVPPASAFTGPAIGGLLMPGDSARPWGEPLEAAIGSELAPVSRQDLAAARATLGALAAGTVLTRVRNARLRAPRLSDLLRFNRVEGVALGAGMSLTPDNGALELVPHAGVGLATGRMTGGLDLARSLGANALTASASRAVRDFGDLPVISPTLNSLTAEEGGSDFGDYLLLDRIALGFKRRIGSRSSLTLELAREHPWTLAVAARPATGSFRANPAFGTAPWSVARIFFGRESAADIPGGDLAGTITAEGGTGTGDYLRGMASVEARVPLGATSLLARGFAGAGT
ncbi:MAG: hypothetical protein ACHQXA_09905, partial [Gemmatimonadales bacterium]